MQRFARSRWLGAALGAALIGSGTAAQAATLEVALGLAPVQKDVEYTIPPAATVAQCSLNVEQLSGHSGWVVRDASGQVIRRFMDTNGDNSVDLWCYFKDGVEVYRDIDSNFNQKADQYRWLNTAGSRWAIDRDEDGRVDAWRTISAEEVSAEVVAALANNDSARFLRLLVTTDELKALGLAETPTKQLTDSLAKGGALFQSLASANSGVKASTHWIDFGGSQPGLVPSGTNGSTKDLLVYENVLAMTETDGEHGQVEIGTIVRVGELWRLLPPGETQGGMFFQPAVAAGPFAGPSARGTDPASQELMSTLESLDRALDTATAPADRARLHGQRAEVLEKLMAGAGSADERGVWVRQLADIMSAAAQTGEYPDAVKKLQSLLTAVGAQDPDLSAYVEFRLMTAQYTIDMQAPNANFVEVQNKWLEDLERYAATYPDSFDASEAMFQLAMGREFAGEEDKAKTWYQTIVKKFPGTLTAQKAQGSIDRLDSIGKQLKLTGKTATGAPFDLSRYQGKVVLVYYWASWSDLCTQQADTLRDFYNRYGKDGFAIVGINLDSDKKQLDQFVAQSRIPWTQVWEQGGLDSRLANMLGIQTVPTMLLLDKSGKVVNRSVQISDLGRELGTLLR